MDENDLLEMGRTLTNSYKKFEIEKQIFEDRMTHFQKNMAIIYAYSRELDMLVEEDNSFPTVIKFMIERLRGISSQILFKDSKNEEDVDFSLFLE